MTREEKAIRNEHMRQYKAEGHSMSEVAEKFNVTKSLAQSVCKGICPQTMRRPKQYRNQYTNCLYERIENCKRIIKQANEHFEYVGGFTNVDGRVQLRCIECGYEFEMSLISLRHRKKNHYCPECKRKENAIAREQKKEAEQIKAQKIRTLNRMQKMLNKDAEQIEMHACPTCGRMILGRKYCSRKCLNQNKWAMKDGYRYLFPLEELFERDHGICYLCGALCQWDDKQKINGVIVYGNYYPSRDHVIPKSKGGENSWENLRLAHRICNSLKHDSPLV